MEFSWWRGGEHTDFHVMSFPKFAAILSIDNSTKLDIRNADNEWITVDIPRGEMLDFRGDVLHHGSKYSSTNKRLYFKLLPNGAELELPCNELPKICSHLKH